MEVKDLEKFIEDFYAVYAGQLPNFYTILFYPEESGNEKPYIEIYLSNGNVIKWDKDERTFVFSRTHTLSRAPFSALDFERALDAYCRFFNEQECDYDTLDNCTIRDGVVAFESYGYFRYYLWDTETDVIVTRG